jgi:hypothetical protein
MSLDYIDNKFSLLCCTESDINEHLPTLYKYTLDCDTVIECGVRGIVSSWAFLKGLVDRQSDNNKTLLLVDKEECDITEISTIAKDSSVLLQYQWINDLDLGLDRNYDLVFIDTWHVYGHLKRELEKFSPITNKYIIMHDTTSDEFDGEAIRMRMNIGDCMRNTGYNYEETVNGLWRAIKEFLHIHPEWHLHEKFANNNGLTILKRIA